MVNGPVAGGTAVTKSGIGFTSASTVNPPPVMTSIGAKTTDIGRLLKFIVNASDSDGNPLTYSATDLPTNVTFDAGTRLFSWTPDYSQTGVYNVSFSVTDGPLRIPRL